VDEKEPSGALVSSTEEDEVFHWGREVDVDWQSAAWVTVRDQVSTKHLQDRMADFRRSQTATLASRARSDVGRPRRVPGVYFVRPALGAVPRIARPERPDDGGSRRID
jgi:hypothetical protein